MDPTFLMTAVYIAFGFLAVLLISVIGFFLTRRIIRIFPGAPVASYDALEHEEWELRHVTTEPRAYRLAAKIRYHGAGSAGVGLASYTGLECDVHVTVGGEKHADETVSFHGKTSERVDRVITFAYMTGELREGTRLTRKGTYVLSEIPRCPAGTEIVCRGIFRPSPGTETSMLDVFLGR